MSDSVGRVARTAVDAAGARRRGSSKDRRDATSALQVPPSIEPDGRPPATRQPDPRTPPLPVPPRVRRFPAAPPSPPRLARLRQIAPAIGVVAVTGAIGLLVGAAAGESESSPGAPEVRGPAVDTGALSAHLKDLSSARATGLRRLAAAETSQAQAARAELLAALHERAAALLDEVPVGPKLADEQRSLVVSVEEAAAAYDRLSQAAAAEKPAKYRAGQAKVDRAASTIRESVDRLRGS